MNENGEYEYMLDPGDVFDGMIQMKSFFTQQELDEKVKKLLIKHPSANYDTEMSRLNNYGDLTRASYKGENVLTLKSLINREHRVYQNVSLLAQRSTHQVSWDDVAAPLVRATEARKSLESGGKPWNYRPDQIDAIKYVLTGPNIVCIQAFAGTGKTTAAGAMIDVYKSQGYNVFAIAPSNKAARQLAIDCGLGVRASKTIDSFLKSKDLKNVGRHTVIFVDESSMASFDHCEKLTKLCVEKGCKLVLQGDKEQLPSVSRGRFFGNIVEQNLAPTCELTVITRQRKEWDKEAVEYAAYGNFEKAIQMREEHNQVRVLADQDRLLERIANDYLNDGREVHTKLVLGSRNSDVDSLNEMIRAELVKQKKLDTQQFSVPIISEKEDPETLVKSKVTGRIDICVGDRLILNETYFKDNRNIAPKSGIGTITGIVPNERTGGYDVSLKLDGEKEPVVINTQDFKHFQHAYAITIHKSQGATVDKAYLAVSQFISSELAYVAMSRHRDEFAMYCTAEDRPKLVETMSKRLDKVDARDLDDFIPDPMEGYKELPGIMKGLYTSDTQTKIVTSYGDIETFTTLKAERYRSGDTNMIIMQTKEQGTILVQEKNGYVSLENHTSMETAKNFILAQHAASRAPEQTVSKNQGLSR